MKTATLVSSDSRSGLLPLVSTPVSIGSYVAAPRITTEISRGLEHCIASGTYGHWPIRRTCGGQGLQVAVDHPEARGECEVVRLADGVWLIAGTSCVRSDVAIWSRNQGSLCFTVLLGGGVLSADEHRCDDRYLCPGGYGAVAVSACDTRTYAQYFVGVRTEGVSVLFRDAQAMRDFGLEPSQVFDFLALQSGRPDPHSSHLALCVPEQAALEAAHALRHPPYEGSLRHLYLKGKACLMLSHLLASRVVARSAADTQALAGSCDAAVAAMARTSLIRTECQPSAGEIAATLGITQSRLLRVFKAQYGVSLAEHALAVRMERARQLLLQTQMPLIDIALICCYEHQSSFSTAYLRTYGETPMQTRRSTLQPV